jgi:hypothetical protein
MGIECFPEMVGFLKADGFHAAEKLLAFNGNGGPPTIGVSPQYWKKRGIDPKRVQRVIVKETLGAGYEEETILFIQTGLHPPDLQTGDEVLVRLTSGNYQLRRWRVKDSKAYTVDMFEEDPIPQVAGKNTSITGKVVKKF